jgi:hypothetical protein
MIAPLLVVGAILLGVAVAVAAYEAITALTDSSKDADKNFPACPVGSPSGSCPLKDKALTPEEAQKWYDHFKNDRPDIPFNYPVDCCYTRAREMDKEMVAAGVPCGKVWNYASPGNALTVPTTNVPASPPHNGQVQWGYHVAPVVPVKQPDGSVEYMVIDPSMEPGPVSIDKWKADQHEPNSTSWQTGPDPYYVDPKRDPPVVIGADRKAYPGPPVVGPDGHYQPGRITPDPKDDEVKKTLEEHRAEKAKLGP